MQAFKIVTVPVTAFQQNCSIVICAATHKAAVVDPGGEMEKIEKALEKVDATVEKILITHGHVDHVGAASPLARKLDVAIEGPHFDDKFLLDGVDQIARAYGLPPAENVTPDRWLADGDTVTVGDLTFDVLHCPGHSPGSVVFVWRAKEGQTGPNFAIVGDVLFRGSVGRTDLPGGSHETLIHSIKSKLLKLPDDTVFICGHGDASTIGEERVSNPFIA